MNLPILSIRIPGPGRCAGKVYEGLPKPSVNNNRQVENAAGVLMVLESSWPLNFRSAEETVKACLRDFRLAGRFQVIPG